MVGIMMIVFLLLLFGSFSLVLMANAFCNAYIYEKDLEDESED